MSFEAVGKKQNITHFALIEMISTLRINCGRKCLWAVQIVDKVIISINFLYNTICYIV